MVETTANQKKLVGNVVLHRGLLVPERRFLRRNLRHILDAHERAVADLKATAGATITNGTSSSHVGGSMITIERSSSGWSYPTKEMLQDLVKGQKPLLRIEALQIRHPHAKGRFERRTTVGDAGPEGEDWLPAPDSGLTLPCTVGVNVTDPAAPRQRIFSESRAATIREIKHDGQPSHFDVELDRPFLVELSRLFTITETGNNGYRWKRTITAKYTLDITIHCDDSEETAELLSCLEGKDASSYSKAPASEGILNASWQNLPECPTAEQGLLLKRSKGHKGNKTFEPEYRLGVDMGWTRRRDTPLEQYNRAVARQERPARQLPTPSGSEDLDKRAKTYEIIYKYEEGLYTRALTVQGLRCPLCTRSQDLSSFERLQLHCTTFHDHFKFEPEATTSNDGRSDEARHVVWISLAPEDREKQDRGPEDIRINWIAPNRPFDVSAHLRGEDDWMGRRPRRAKARAARNRQTAATARSNHASAGGPPLPVRKRPSLDEVEDLPKARPRKRRVPNVPNVYFYHSRSKQRIPAGSFISDSDDDIDQSWMQDKEEHELKKYEVAGAKKEFILAFDGHMKRERPESNLFVREALVRFTRSHIEKLQDSEFRLLFWDKLDTLRKHGIVSEETVKYCSELVMSSLRGGRTASVETTPGTDPENRSGSKAKGIYDEANGGVPSRPRRRWVNGTGMVDRTAESDQPGEPDEELPNDAHDAVPTVAAGMCTCGKSALGERAALACTDLVSVAPISFCLEQNANLAVALHTEVLPPRVCGFGEASRWMAMYGLLLTASLSVLGDRIHEAFCSVCKLRIIRVSNVQPDLLSKRSRCRAHLDPDPINCVRHDDGMLLATF